MNEMRYYNGITEAEMANAYGLQKLGIEHCKPFFTRAVVIDVAGLKGRMLDKGEEITVADVTGALAASASRSRASSPATASSSTPGGAACG